MIIYYRVYGARNVNNDQTAALTLRAQSSTYMYIIYTSNGYMHL